MGCLAGSGDTAVFGSNADQRVLRWQEPRGRVYRALIVEPDRCQFGGRRALEVLQTQTGDTGGGLTMCLAGLISSLFAIRG